MKLKRQAKIMELIQSNDIETQEQLLMELNAQGFTTTQATISRDIKELRIVKEQSAGGIYRYSASPRHTDQNLTSRLNSIFKQSIVSCDHAQNIVVIKTMPGLASAACSAIDAMDLDVVVGTIAGDDTAFLVIRDTASAAAICSDFKRHLA